MVTLLFWEQTLLVQIQPYWTRLLKVNEGFEPLAFKFTVWHSTAELHLLKVSLFVFCMFEYV